MDESRRLAYLAAMGIRVWERRAKPALGEARAVHSPPDLEATAPLTQPVAGSPVVDHLGQGADGPQTAAVSLAPVPLDAPPRSQGMDWESLAASVRTCRACRLWETRTQAVFGVGNRQAELMIIGEAPGADEDAQGEPFVGRAGQLLNRMLEAIGLKRDQVYIANVLKCRPPGNRDPRPDEVLACQGYLHRQIELVSPRVILAVGRISAQNLLKTDIPVGRLRERWFEYGPQRIPLRVTYHPAYLLRSPEQKARSWDDLVAVKRRLIAVGEDQKRGVVGDLEARHRDQFSL